MARKPAPAKARESEASPADQAFGAARAFVEHLATLAYHARRFQPRPDKPDAWQDLAMTYAMAFVAWFDLTHLLTPAVRTEARRVYPPGSPAIKLGKLKPMPTVIEAVADELGVYFRNTVYAGRRHPLEPDTERVANEAKARATARQVAHGKPAEPFGWGADFDELMKKETRAAVRERLGLKTYGDVQDLLMREWTAQDRDIGESSLSLLRCGSIDFDDLQTQLIREAEAVIAAASKPNAPTIDPAILGRLEAGIAAVHSIGSNVDAGMARVIESLGARDDDKAPAAKLPELKAHDRQAWQLATLHKMTQQKVADTLNEEHGTTYTQGQVSRMIDRAKAHAVANGLAEKVAGPIDRPRTVDPSRLALGARVDKRRPRPSDMRRANDDDE